MSKCYPKNLNRYSTCSFKDKVARDVLRTLPLEVLTVLGSPSWKGGPLVAVDEPGKPSASTLGKNFPWLLPFVKDSPSKAMWLSNFPVLKWYLLTTPLIFIKGYCKSTPYEFPIGAKCVLHMQRFPFSGCIVIICCQLPNGFFGFTTFHH